MFGKFGKLTRKFGRLMWVNFEESAAIMAGQTIEITDSGDTYARSPVIHEVTTETRTSETHARSIGHKHN